MHFVQCIRARVIRYTFLAYNFIDFFFILILASFNKRDNFCNYFSLMHHCV